LSSKGRAMCTMIVWSGVAASSEGGGGGRTRMGAVPMREWEVEEGGGRKRVEVTKGAREREGRSSCCSSACTQAPGFSVATIT